MRLRIPMLPEVANHFLDLLAYSLEGDDQLLIRVREKPPLRVEPEEESTAPQEGLEVPLESLGSSGKKFREKLLLPTSPLEERLGVGPGQLGEECYLSA